MKPVPLSLFGIAALLVCAFAYADDDRKYIEISVGAAPVFETLTKGGIKFFNPSNTNRPTPIPGRQRNFTLESEEAFLVLVHGQNRTSSIQFSKVYATFLGDDLSPRGKYYPPKPEVVPATPLATLGMVANEIPLDDFASLLPDLAAVLGLDGEKFHAWVENARRLPEATNAFSAEGKVGDMTPRVRVAVSGQDAKSCYLSVILTWKDPNPRAQPGRSGPRKAPVPASRR